MRTDPPTSTAVRKLGELIDHIQIAMLVSLAADGQTLVSRPLATLESDGQSEIWFFIRDDSGTVDDVTLHPQVNLSYADPHHNRYVSVVGKASLVRDRERIDELWTSRVEPYFPQGRDDPTLRLLKVEVQSAEYWQQPGHFAREAVELLGSISGNNPVDLGEEHQRLHIG